MTSLKMARAILFTGQIDAMSEFYGKDPDGNPIQLSNR